jgi:hypothetical protein
MNSHLQLGNIPSNARVLVELYAGHSKRSNDNDTSSLSGGGRMTCVAAAVVNMFNHNNELNYSNITRADDELIFLYGESCGKHGRPLPLFNLYTDNNNTNKPMKSDPGAASGAAAGVGDKPPATQPQDVSLWAPGGNIQDDNPILVYLSFDWPYRKHLILTQPPTLSTIESPRYKKDSINTTNTNSEADITLHTELELYEVLEERLFRYKPREPANNEQKLPRIIGKSMVLL